MNQLLTLKQNRAALIQKMGEITTKCASEGRAMSADENTKWEAMFADEANIRKTIEAVERTDALQRESEQSQEQRSREQRENPESPEVRYSKAFEQYLRRGLNDMEPESREVLRSGFRTAETRASGSVGTAADGGYTVPQGFQNELLKAMKWFGGALNLKTAKIITTDTGNTLPWPIVNDTGNTGEQLDENTSIGSSVIPTFGSRSLVAYKFSSKPAMLSSELLNDSAFNLESEVAQMLGERLGRIMNTKFTTADGSSTPQGFTDVTDTNFKMLVGKTGASGQTGSVIYDDLVDLMFSIDKSWRGLGTEWTFNDATLKILMKLVDGNDRPLFWNQQASLGGGGDMGDVLMGRPVVINNDVATMAANAYSMVYGNFSTFAIRLVKNTLVRRLNERYADLDQVAFIAFQRADSKILGNTNSSTQYGSYKAYRNAAS